MIHDASGLGLGPGNGLGLTERDNEEIDSHRHLYVGFHVPKSKRTEGGKHHHHHGSSKNKHSLKPPVQNLRPGEEARSSFSWEILEKGNYGIINCIPICNQLSISLWIFWGKNSLSKKSKQIANQFMKNLHKFKCF